METWGVRLSATSADDLSDFEQVAGVAGVYERDVAAGLDASCADVVEHACQRFWPCRRGRHLAARVRFQGDDFHTVTKLAAAGLGVALLPALVLRDSAWTIISRPIDDTPFVRYIYICRLDTKQVPVALQELERCLINSYK